jgi:hypothetical protein
VSEPEAVAAWWPWGRRPPRIIGGPPKPPRTRKVTLDPAIITVTKPTDVVREVMAKTGMNRTSAQLLTASMRKVMRAARVAEAARLLGQEKTRAEVARLVGLSPSRISALFPRGNPPPDPAAEEDLDIVEDDEFSE